MLDTELYDILHPIKTFPSQELNKATRLIDDLGFTSLDIMNLILALEEKYRITFNDEDLELESFATVGAVVSTVNHYHAGV